MSVTSRPHRSWHPSVSLGIASDLWEVKLPSAENHWFAGRHKSGVSHWGLITRQSTPYNNRCSKYLNLRLFAVMLTWHSEDVLIISTDVCVFGRLFRTWCYLWVWLSPLPCDLPYLSGGSYTPLFHCLWAWRCDLFWPIKGECKWQNASSEQRPLLGFHLLPWEKHMPGRNESFCLFPCRRRLGEQTWPGVWNRATTADP